MSDWPHPPLQSQPPVVEAGEFNIQAMDIETFFFRRKNMNATGQQRSWTDHLLWHHSAHSIDIFQYMTGAKVVTANAIQWPKHPGAWHCDGYVDPA